MAYYIYKDQAVAQARGTFQSNCEWIMIFGLVYYIARF